MPSSEPSELAQNPESIFRLFSNYLGQNQIKNRGCEYLSRANWTNLTYIYLSKFYYMYITIVSEIKDASI